MPGVPRWNAKRKDADAIREAFRLGLFNPTNYSPTLLHQHSNGRFLKYPIRNFNRNVEKIDDEFNCVGRRAQSK